MPLAPYAGISHGSAEATSLASARPSIVTEWHRHTLLLLSAAVVAFLAGSAHILAFIGTSALASYLSLIAGQWLIGVSRQSIRTRRIVLTVNWVIWIGLFVMLEVTGKIGTLTGNSATLIDQWAVTLGLPFYALSMAAANSDVLAGKLRRPEFNLYLLYVLYFPKFLSGPIERPGFIRQLETFKFSIDLERFDRGGRWVLLGVFYKFLIGRLLARLYFPEISDNTLVLAVGITAFELRVYFDLCGYSLMAYGTSLMLGIELTLNFNHPFFAGNLRDFWRCWHISLGRWFHDYVFEPFRRSGVSESMLAWGPLVVFMVSAAWHGITANFLLWGLFHASAFLLYTKVLRHYAFPRLVKVAAFFGALMFGRLLFMDADLPRLMMKFATLLDVWQWTRILLHPGSDWSQLTRLVPATTWLIALTSIGFVFVTEGQNVKRKLPAYTLFFGWRMYVVVIALAALATCGIEGMIYARQ